MAAGTPGDTAAPLPRGANSVSDDLVRIDARAGAGRGPLALPDGQTARWMGRRLKRNALARA